jgi:hypothetical protein
MSMTYIEEKMNPGLDQVTMWHKIIRNEDGTVKAVNLNHMDTPARRWVREYIPKPKGDYPNQVAWERDEWLKEWSFQNSETKKIVTGSKFMGLSVDDQESMLDELYDMAADEESGKVLTDEKKRRYMDIVVILDRCGVAIPFSIVY